MHLKNLANNTRLVCNSVLQSTTKAILKTMGNTHGALTSLESEPMMDQDPVICAYDALILAMAMDEPCKPKLLKQLYQTYDKQDSGTIDTADGIYTLYKDLFRIVQTKSKSNEKQLLLDEDAFMQDMAKIFDPAHSGVIPFNEFSKGMAQVLAQFSN